jgi:hypothetical protein
MNTLLRWMNALAIGPLAVLTLQGLAMDACALTDANAELKEAAADRAARVVVTAKAARPAPVQTAWVPVPAKRLDGFKPVLPPERRDTTEKLAAAGVAAPAKR